MDMVKKAAAALMDAEQKLREIGGNAFQAGQYDESERIAIWARSLGDMARAANGNGHAIGQQQSVASANVPSRTQSIASKTAPRRAPRTGDYPRFFRSGDQLVKIGWSKKERSEYEHKAPRKVIDSLAAAIARRAGKGRVFTTDELLPLKDTADGNELPGYQAYLALAWFKHAGVIKQHGRRGYSAKEGSVQNGSIATLWSSLSSYRG